MSVLLDEALKLPIPERQKLRDEIDESIDAAREIAPLTPEQEAELIRRIEDYKKNRGGNFSWEEIRDAALAR
jgi:putative addiction module component (TIGR02574 family)